MGWTQIVRWAQSLSSKQASREQDNKRQDNKELLLSTQYVRGKVPQSRNHHPPRYRFPARTRQSQAHVKPTVKKNQSR
jgi:hypothetical protein